MTRPSAWLLVVLLFAACRPVSADDLGAFARCLTQAGATFYVTEWCGYCRKQRAMFGDAVRYLRVVDCTGAGGDGIERSCREHGITGFPTWTFRSRPPLRGLQTVEALSRASGCPEPERVGGRPEPIGTRVAPPFPTRERRVEGGGPRIIELRR